MDERFRGVTLVNTLNTNPLNTLSPHMSWWVQANWLKAARSCSSAGNKGARAATVSAGANGASTKGDGAS